MNIHKPKTFLTAIVTLTIVLLSSCEKGEKFTIRGNVQDADGKMLYLKDIGINGTSVVDSLRLDGTGDFKFSEERPECYGFYRLQLDGKGRQITVAIDSTETVTVTTSSNGFAENCQIEGSPESMKIKELTELENSLQEQVRHMIENTSPAVGETREKIITLIEDFKRNICKEYILPAPHKASAYYSLFLTLNGQPIFNPMQNSFDSKCFAAVATSLNNYFPHTTRSAHLYNTAMKGMKATRQPQRDTLDISSFISEAKGLFEIKLPNIDGDSISLSAQKGKVVLLDFTVYGNPQINTRNIDLRELYSDYKEKGFEIYQISYDTNEHFWKTSAENLPWICVHDDIENSQNSTLYRIEKLPTYFLINRDNELVLRDKQVKDLRETIEKLLSE